MAGAAVLARRQSDLERFCQILHGDQLPRGSCSPDHQLRLTGFPGDWNTPHKGREGHRCGGSGVLEFDDVQVKIVFLVLPTH